MGFIDRDFNRQALRRANNDISEAITILTSCNYFDDDTSDRCETTTTPTFIDSLTKEQVEQQTVRYKLRAITTTKKIKTHFSQKESKIREKEKKVFWTFFFSFIFVV